MTITTNDGLTAAIAGTTNFGFFKTSATAEAAGQFHSYFIVAGRPGVGTAPSVGLNGQTVDNSFGGTMTYANAGGGAQKYLSSFSGSASLAGKTILYDRLWQNSGYTVTTTTAQNTTFSGLPSRDEGGSNTGANVELWIEVYTATTNAGAVTNMTCSYTNQAGTAARTGTVTSFPATAVAGTMVPFNLQAGDTGVRSVQSLTLGTSLVTGAVGLVCIRRLSELDCVVANTGTSKNFYDNGVRLFDATALCLMGLVTTTTAPVLVGQVGLIEG